MKFRNITIMLAIALVAPSLVVAEDGSFDSNGVKIHYVTQGKGEAVVLIHGFLADHAMWGNRPFLNSLGDTQVMATLAKEFRIIALDCRGHGESGKPAKTGSYGPAMAEDVVGLLDHLKIPKAHLVGYSMGSLIAGRVAATHPERVLSVTFGGGAAILPTEPKSQEAFAKGVEDGTALIPLVIGLSPADKAKPTPQEAEVIVKKLLSAEARIALAAVCRSFANIMVTQGELKKCTAPVLYIYGANDYPHIKTRVPEELKLLGRGEVKVVEGTDHLSTPGSPEFRATILKFLRANRQLAGGVHLDNEQVLRIAHDAVAANDTWVEKAEFETPKRRADGSWSVFVWRLPHTPGGHRLILIDEKGNVTAYQRGS